MAKFIMLVGIPYSGKSHLAEKLAKKYSAKIHSSDELREELFGDVNAQNSNRELFAELHRRVINNLRAGKNAIYDATNINRQRRVEMLEMARKRSGCECICYFLDTPLDVCFARKKLRFRVVPDEVIRKMYNAIEPPSLDEGWDELRVITPADAE